MIIFNTTVNVENSVKEEWLQWMKTQHIPRVMETGFFIENMVCKVMVNEEQGTTYSIQYTCKSVADYEEFSALHAPRLQKEVAEKYGEKCVSFQTLLEII